MNGPASPSNEDPKARVELLKRIEALHPVPKLDGAQFVAGARLRLRRGIDQDRALAIVAELQAVGANVEVEANRPPDEAILALDQFHDAEPEPDHVAALNEKMLAQLQSLDADEPQPAIDRDAATRAELAPAKPSAAPKPMPPKPTAPSEPVDDARFRPSGDWHKPMELELERAPLPPSPPPPSPEEEATAAEQPLPPSPIVDETWRPVPGRIAQGALRKNPPLRIAIGVVAGLFVGWMFAQPYARHSERHVAELRAQADAERYRPVEEAQMRVRALDRQADDASSSGAFGMAAIWLLVGAGAFAGWWRAT
ncbi:MAG TPA: hypothetical protein VN947_18385 [Polyangia bacterium]|nr:hypothetical protein [Polyangia bacterium]